LEPGAAEAGRGRGGGWGAGECGAVGVEVAGGLEVGEGDFGVG
jgi:hypothetical protein